MTPRSRISLDGQWQFWPDPAASLTPDSLIIENCSLITVPSPWQSQSPDLRNFSGPAWYQRTVEIPQDWLEQCIMIGFGAADYFAEAWLNGVKAGEHEGGYLPFELDVTHAAHPGTNILTVRVTDPPEIFPEVPHGKQSWYVPLSGLWQSVWIENRSRTHIRRVRITPQGEQVDVDVTLNGDLTPGSSLRFEVLSPMGDICCQGESQSPAISLSLPEPLLWDIESPNLYTLSVNLYEGETPPLRMDAVIETFGFRTIETCNGQILLNGKPLYLRGALDQDYYPELICTPPSVGFLEDQFRKAKAMGLNCLRTHIKIADPRYYAAADRLGLLIWNDLPNWDLLSPAARRRARETLTGMVERDWNHPSIVIWTIINESWGIDLTDPEQRAWLVQTYDYLKSLDPYRLVVDNSACAGNSHLVTDIEDCHNYYAMPDHYAEWRDWVAKYAARPPWTFAHVYESAAAWREYMSNPWEAQLRPPAPEVRRRGDEPLVISEFGNWGLPDVNKLYQYYEGNAPWWFETGWEWGEPVVYPHGVEERFRAYHLDRAFPSLSALSEASQRLQFAALKYEIEQIRRHPSLVGYVITEFTDVNWECNGLLDLCRNPKAHFEALGKLNADDLILPGWQRLAYWEAERCEVSLSLSHFSSLDLMGSRLEWHLDGWPEVQGAFEGLTPRRADVTDLGIVDFVVPALERSQRTRLELRLFQEGGQLAASSFLELFFFLRQAAEPFHIILYAPALAGPLRRIGYIVTEDLSTADMVVTGIMTDELRQYLMNGGRVLWLAESDDALQTYLGGLSLSSRRGTPWAGDWASSLSWLPQDSLFNGLPTQGAVDFAFAGLTPEHVIPGLGLRDFATDVHAGLCLGWLHKAVGLVVDRRLGKGHMLVSTFRLSQSLETNPVAAIMLHDMLAHLAAR